MTGPLLLAVSVILVLALSAALGPRQVALYGAFGAGASAFVSLVSALVAVTESWGNLKSMPRVDHALLFAGALPAALGIAVAAYAAYSVAAN
jgi:hypothetical protein